ncbi:unnamed protein product [Linum tenue]|uniref:Uncharacterized protein n=1 Tax=Linum tenue TaxID=586396 RepID=A0AAV0R8T3_9ROSI|nr:unnamed protein product [Linum tenue]
MPPCLRAAKGMAGNENRLNLGTALESGMSPP